MVWKNYYHDMWSYHLRIVVTSHKTSSMINQTIWRTLTQNTLFSK